MTVELGKLEHVDPRQAWVNEAHDFTPWLLENADRLSEALGIELEFDAAEHAVGGSKLDLVGRDLTNDAVLIVENQLEPTDHSHLGQVLTYAAGTSASTIVWIATAFREEHRQAIDWLNENTGDDAHFFGIELQLVRIGNSLRAPLFNVVAQPNEWQKRVRAATQATAVRGKGVLYLQFWTRLLERLHTQHPDWTKTRNASADNWIEMRAPFKGTKFAFVFAQGERLRNELYIDTGDGDKNTELFNHLHHQRAQIESSYGSPLSWEDLPDRRACRLADYKEGCTVEQEDRHEEFIDWFFDASTRMRAALSSAPISV